MASSIESLLVGNCDFTLCTAKQYADMFKSSHRPNDAYFLTDTNQIYIDGELYGRFNFIVSPYKTFDETVNAYKGQEAKYYNTLFEIDGCLYYINPSNNAFAPLSQKLSTDVSTGESVVTYTATKQSAIKDNKYNSLKYNDTIRALIAGINKPATVENVSTLADAFKKYGNVYLEITAGPSTTNPCGYTVDVKQLKTIADSILSKQIDANRYTLKYNQENNTTKYYIDAVLFNYEWIITVNDTKNKNVSELMSSLDILSSTITGGVRPTFSDISDDLANIYNPSIFMKDFIIDIQIDTATNTLIFISSDIDNKTKNNFTVNLPKDLHIKTGHFDSNTKTLILEYNDGTSLSLDVTELTKPKITNTKTINLIDKSIQNGIDELSANIQISKKAGNSLSIKEDGLYRSKLRTNSPLNMTPGSILVANKNRGASNKNIGIAPLDKSKVFKNHVINESSVSIGDNVQEVSKVFQKKTTDMLSLKDMINDLGIVEWNTNLV